MRPWARAVVALGSVGRTMAPPTWLDAEHDASEYTKQGDKSNRRRLLVHLSIRDGETDKLLGKGQTDVTIEPPPQNRN
jgi:hypothetical protein